MKPHYQLITDLISMVGKFEKEKKSHDINLETFVLWINREVLLQKREIYPKYKDEGHPTSLSKNHFKISTKSKKEYLATRANVQLALLLHMLSKHFKLYSKKVLFDTDLVSMDGHTFLSMLYHTDSMRKMELIRANYSEVPSGIEVIKRLLGKGFIDEFDDRDDKRSKRVRITKNGKKEYEATLPDMRKVIDIMAGGLEDEKKILLTSLLDELNDFHNERHDQVKNLSLDELLAASNA